MLNGWPVGFVPIVSGIVWDVPGANVNVKAVGLTVICPNAAVLRSRMAVTAVLTILPLL
jgi:hypothetical protein